MSHQDATVAERLKAVRDKISAAAREAGRADDAVTLIAVSKTFGPDAIEPVIRLGQRVFGENRVQEAESKWPALRENTPDLDLHLIGPLQSNKVKSAVALFDVIQTVDRAKVARAIAREADAQGRCPKLFIQINTGEEPQKAGVLPVDADAFIQSCRRDFGLEIEGLMCIPPVEETPSLHFALLAKIAGRNGVRGLSMGMSADFETAVAFGATHVRVGSAIFGARAPFRPAESGAN